MMIHPDIHSALARERISTFLAHAEAARRARQLRRPVRPADDGLLAGGFARLSDRFRRMRYLPHFLASWG